jgi:hypothetical protein
MEEIKRRTVVVHRLRDLHKKGEAMTGYMETDIDLVYLQLRKMTELVMFACVIANKAAGVELNKTLRKGWELKKIKAELKKFNVEFFPVPKVEGEVSADGIRKVEDLDSLGVPYLSEDELFHAYSAAGGYLHAQREYQYGNAKEKLEILLKGVEYVGKLVALLKQHWVKVDEQTQFAVVMQRPGDGRAHVAYMKEGLWKKNGKDWQRYG